MSLDLLNLLGYELARRQWEEIQQLVAADLIAQLQWIVGTAATQAQIQAAVDAAVEDFAAQGAPVVTQEPGGPVVLTAHRSPVPWLALALLLWLATR